MPEQRLCLRHDGNDRWCQRNSACAAQSECFAPRRNQWALYQPARKPLRIQPIHRAVFTETMAPGLATQPPFAQLGEGARIEPTLFNDHLQIDYLAQFQQYIAPSDGHYPFRRYTFDLDHIIPLYHNAASYGPNPTNGPDECAAFLGATKCSAIQRNREGSVELRLLITGPSLRPAASSPSTSSRPWADRTSTVTPGSPAIVTTVFALPTPCCCAKPSSTPSGALSASPSPPIKAKSRSLAMASTSINLHTASRSVLRCALEACQLCLSPSRGVDPRAHTRLPT
ncbi:hypothetical protein SBA5_380014 [Candidatus Sulfotelmatomonas gaucii]|uniref:Uncharacterized protein n=1 Tax=Candidatus Sulfuritelmatomonas gaucii TaxID=2043161 RepID=A0A2N9LJC8_9BACT|nr:hypothetical protein SBA5_380014 [Candidatus Sulfotelmatomonas gaucii]